MRIRTAILLVMGWIFVLTSVAITLSNLTNYAPTFPYSDMLESSPLWLRLFAQFDGVHYLTIATRGYKEVALIQAFFPVYPLAISILSGFTNHIPSLIAVGRLISILACIISVYLWPKLARNFSTTSQYQYSLSALLLWPVSFFFFSLYSESVFLALVLGTLLLAHKKHFFWAALFGAIASGTRIVGVFLFPALLIELWIQTRPTDSVFYPKLQLNLLLIWAKTHIASIVVISLSLLGWLAYSSYLQMQFNDFFYYFHVQQEFGGGRQENIILLPQVIFRYLKIAVTASINWSWYASMQELLLSMVAFVALVIGWRKIRFSLWFFSLCVLLLPTFTGTLSSMPRYILVAPAVFLALGEFGKDHKSGFRIFLGMSTLLLLINLFLFAQGLWVS